MSAGMLATSRRMVDEVIRLEVCNETAKTSDMLQMHSLAVQLFDSQQDILMLPQPCGH
jgi:hypothetical protein